MIAKGRGKKLYCIEVVPLYLHFLQYEMRWSGSIVAAHINRVVGSIPYPSRAKAERILASIVTAVDFACYTGKRRLGDCIKEIIEPNG